MSHQVKAALREVADPQKAEFYPRFFKTGPGEYAEGDRFLGVTVPLQRKIARRFRDLTAAQVGRLLANPIHECRLTALLIMVLQYDRGDAVKRQALIDLYLSHLQYINNWDLVDSSAEKLLGRHLVKGDRSVLDRLADSGDLWQQRIAIIACLYFIKRDDFRDIKRLSRHLLTHPHDLMHKAIGWMLREMGKRDHGELESFLQRHYRRMPRTMLRYAIERFDEPRRQQYLKGRIGPQAGG